jgi:integrase
VLLLAYGGLRIGEALRLRRKHLHVDGGRVVVELTVTELPGGPIIDTPKDHQRRELLVPAFVIKAVRRYLATVPDGPDVFCLPGQAEAHRCAPAELQRVSSALPPGCRRRGSGGRHAARSAGDACELGSRLARRDDGRSSARSCQRERHDQALCSAAR